MTNHWPIILTNHWPIIDHLLTNHTNNWKKQQQSYHSWTTHVQCLTKMNSHRKIIAVSFPLTTWLTIDSMSSSQLPSSGGRDVFKPLHESVMYGIRGVEQIPGRQLVKSRLRGFYIKCTCHAHATRRKPGRRLTPQASLPGSYRRTVLLCGRWGPVPFCLCSFLKGRRLFLKFVPHCILCQSLFLFFLLKSLFLLFHIQFWEWRYCTVVWSIAVIDAPTCRGDALRWASVRAAPRR